MSKLFVHPQSLEEFLAIEALGTLLSTLHIASALDIIETIEQYRPDFECSECSYIKEDCVCEDTRFHGRYYSEYDDG